jgi:hypothetical protein
MAQSGQITVTTAGTEVRGTSEYGSFFAVKALPANVGIMYIGNNGDDTVSSTTGYPLSAGDEVILELDNLNQMWVDASINGEKVAWIKIVG